MDTSSMLREALNTQHFSIEDISIPFFTDLKLPLLNRNPQPKSDKLDVLTGALLRHLENASPSEREAFLASSASILPGKYSELVKAHHLGLASLRSQLRSSHAPTSLDYRFAEFAKANALALNEQFQGLAPVRTPGRRVVLVDMESDDFMGLGKLFSYQANQSDVPLDVVLRTPFNASIAKGLTIAKDDYQTEHSDGPLNIEFYDGATDLTQENDYRAEYFQRLASHCEQLESGGVAPRPLLKLDSLAEKVITELNAGEPVDLILLCEPDDLMVLLQQVEREVEDKAALSRLALFSSAFFTPRFSKRDPLVVDHLTPAFNATGKHARLSSASEALLDFAQAHQIPIFSVSGRAEQMPPVRAISAELNGDTDTQSGGIYNLNEALGRSNAMSSLMNASFSLWGQYTTHIHVLAQALFVSGSTLYHEAKYQQHFEQWKQSAVECLSDKSTDVQSAIVKLGEEIGQNGPLVSLKPWYSAVSQTASGILSECKGTEARNSMEGFLRNKLLTSLKVMPNYQEWKGDVDACIQGTADKKTADSYQKTTTLVNGKPLWVFCDSSKRRGQVMSYLEGKGMSHTTADPMTVLAYLKPESVRYLPFHLTMPTADAMSSANHAKRESMMLGVEIAQPGTQQKVLVYVSAIASCVVDGEELLP